MANGDLRLLPPEDWRTAGPTPDGMFIIGAHVVEGEEFDTLVYTKIMAAEMPAHIRNYIDERGRQQNADMLERHKARA